MTTDALRRFEAEHDEALAALIRLERAADGLRSNRQPGNHLTVALEVLEHLTGAVRLHNEAEERALFPLLGPEAPLGPFLEEHRTLRRLEDGLARALARGGGPEAADLALEIVDLLRLHIQRENEVLFPMARALLGPAGLAAVARALDSQAG